MNHRAKLKVILLFTYFLLFTTYTFGEEEYTAQGLRDPFSSLIPEEVIEIEEIPISELRVFLPEFNIEGLVWGTPHPQAIIEGKVVKIGDTIEGAKIISISKSGIEIIYEGRIFSFPPPGLERKERRRRW